MSLIINSNGKVERLPPFTKMIRRVVRDLQTQARAINIGLDLDVATGDALDKLADLYGVRRANASCSDGEFCEESDEALRNRMLYIVRGYV
jgi:uncharacterized phage protein gp47/JayE